LKQWMKPQRVPTPLYFWPGKSEIIPQPLGVVGIISPWNYPFYLSFSPVIAALAAGNRVVLKPSELTARTSELLKEMVASAFAPDYVFVPNARLQEFIAAVGAATAKFYPSMADNPDYTSIVNHRHLERLTGYLEDARQRGAKIIEINPANESVSPDARKMPLH